MALFGAVLRKLKSLAVGLILGVPIGYEGATARRK
jgi:hypothetical protein